MEEKTIIIGKPNRNKALLIVIGVIAALLFVFALFNNGSFGDLVIPAIILAIILTIAVIILFVYTNNCEITVTDKRILGKAAFGKRVDLPLDSISAVSTISLLKGIGVSSSSGTIKFLYISNADDIHRIVSELLVERQNKSHAETTIRQEIQQSNADELKKYKELLDNDVITQEEFDAKKKQLLGL